MAGEPGRAREEGRSSEISELIMHCVDMPLRVNYLIFRYIIKITDFSPFIGFNLLIFSTLRSQI